MQLTSPCWVSMAGTPTDRSSTLPVNTLLRGTAVHQQLTGVGNCIGLLYLANDGKVLWVIRPQLYGSHGVSKWAMRDRVWEPWFHLLGVQSSYGDAGRTETDKNVPCQPNGMIVNKKKKRKGWAPSTFPLNGPRDLFTENTPSWGHCAVLLMKRGRRIDSVPSKTQKL